MMRQTADADALCEISSSGSASPTSYFARPSTPQKIARSDLRPLSAHAMKPNISPFKTPRHLKAPVHNAANSFTAPRPLGPDELQNVLDMQILSPSQKELAVRVFNAAQRLRDWCREVEDWGWTGRWEDFGGRVEHEATFESGHADDRTNDDVDYRLSERFEQYADRLDVISENLARLDMDEVKEQVLGVHMSRSRPGSGYAAPSLTPSKVQLYNDFELFVTQALIQSLPYLETLRQAIRTWSVRLAVLDELPAFLIDLRMSQARMRGAFSSLRREYEGNFAVEFTSTLEADLRDSIESFECVITKLGSRLDRMLDALEGGDDEGTFPEHWIDDFERLESEYGTFAAEAQQRLFEFRLLQPAVPVNEDVDESNDLGPETDGVAEVPGTTGALETHPGSLETAKRTKELHQHLGSANHIEPIRPLTAQSLEQPFTLLPEPAIARLNGADGPDDLTGLGERDSDESDNGSTSELCHGEAHPRNYSDCDPHSTVIRRASVTSVESYKRSQVKTLNIKRNSSASSKSGDPLIESLPSSPLYKRESSFHTQQPSPLSETTSALEPFIRDDVEIQLDDTDHHSVSLGNESPGSRSMSSVDSIQSEPPSPTPMIEESPSGQRLHVLSKVPMRPLNGLMLKTRQRRSPLDSPVHELSSTTTPTKLPTGSNKSPGKTAMPLQEQISEIITGLPASIHLVSSPTSTSINGVDAEAALEASPSVGATPPEKPKVHKRRSSLQGALIRSRVSTPTQKNLPALTLAPADEITSRKAGAHDPEIRLYHLTQHGATKPIKLFVRRVGENGERVMVRVGGGWADLGEYLRVFVEHHSRVVSTGSAAVLPVGESTPGSGSRSSKGAAISTPSTKTGRRSLTPTLNSFISEEEGTSRLRVTSEEFALAPLSAYNIASTTNDEPSSELGLAAIPHDFGSIRPTSSSGSRKTSAAWDDSSIGLAGPARRTKNREISDEKREWVDGIVEQARRTVSGAPGTAGGSSTGGAAKEERRSTSRLGFSTVTNAGFRKMEVGGLGEAGKGTKRVFLKSRD